MRHNGGVFVSRVRRTQTWFAAVPVMVIYMAVPWRCSLLTVAPDLGSGSGSALSQPYGPKTPEVPAKRETLANGNGHAPATRTVTLPDEVIVRVMDLGRVAIVRCFKKASFNDPTVFSYKVRLHVELDRSGMVMAATSDADDAALAACLIRVGFQLPFPPPGEPAVVDVPLFYRPE